MDAPADTGPVTNYFITVETTSTDAPGNRSLYNIHTLDWDDELLGILGIPRGVLPKVVPSCGEVALTSCEGLPDAIPIAGMAGDQQAALFGQACHRAGMAKNTYGTGCFILLNTGATPVASEHGLLTTVATGPHVGLRRHGLFIIVRDRSLSMTCT